MTSVWRRFRFDIANLAIAKLTLLAWVLACACAILIAFMPSAAAAQASCTVNLLVAPGATVTRSDAQVRSDACGADLQSSEYASVYTRSTTIGDAPNYGNFTFLNPYTNAAHPDGCVSDHCESGNLYGFSFTADTNTNQVDIVRVDINKAPNNQVTTLATIYYRITIAPVPTITSLSPTAGTTGGGTTVVITGTGFVNGGSLVKFGVNPATASTVNSATQIVATAPAGTVGAANVTVTTVGGTSASGPGNVYTYYAPPTIAAAFSPGSIGTTGSATLTITLTNPAGNPGTISGVGFTASKSSNQLTLANPATTCGGTATVNASSISLSGGTIAAGASCTVTASATSTVAGSYSITPGQATSTTPALVGANGAMAPLTVLPQPTVTGVSPNQGTTIGGTAITIDGTNFTTGSTVTVGGAAATNVAFVNATQLTATTPAGTAGAASVQVTSAGGTSTTNGTFTYVTPPTATAQSVTTAPNTAIAVTLAGTNATTYSVTANPTHGTLSGAAPSLTYTPAANYSGPDSFQFTTTNGAGTSAPATVSITVVPPAPVVTGVNPATGSALGGTGVTITGTAFTGATAVSFGGTAAQTFTVTSDTSISAVAPAHAAGVVDVIVTTPQGSSPASAGDQFTYTTPVIAVAPATLPAATVGAAYSQTITASGGTAPYSYAVSAGALPAGLTLASNGTLSGTPTAGGSFTFSITATDSSTAPGPYSAVQPYTLTVNAPTITVAPTTLPNATGGTAYAQTLSATGGTAPYTYALSAGALPTGTTLAANGTLSGTPTAAGVYNFTVLATDSSTGTGHYSGSRAYSVTVDAPTVVLAPAALANGQVATAYSATVTASGSTVPYSFAVTAGALPTGITLANDGTLSGTPSAGGTFNFTVTATDANAFTGSQAYSLTIAAATIAIAPTTLPDGTRNVAYSQTITASGGTAPYTYARTAGAVPTGLTLASNGTLSGTPTAVGSYSFTVTATDSSTGSGPYIATQNYTVAIAAPTVALAPPTLPNATRNVAYSQTITASGGAAPYSYAVTAGALPAGLTLSTGGALSGTPTATGSYSFTVTATDANSNTGSRAYTLDVTAPSVVLAPTTLPGATVAAAYSQAITASGGAAPYSYAVTAGALPAGLTLSATGTLSGTPTAGGTFTFTVTATDANSNVGTGSYTLTVAAPTIAVAPSALPAATTNVAYSQNITASGGIAPYSYVLTAGSLPPGLALGANGVLAGTPTGGGSYGFTISATDSATGSGPYQGSQSYTLAVSAPAISLAPQVLAGATVTRAYSATITASGGTAPYSYAITAGVLPTGLAFAPDGTISGTPTAGGTFNVSVTATDANGNSGSQGYALTVAAPTIAVAPTTLPAATRNVAYSQAVTASGGIAPYTYAVTAGTLPTGLTLRADGTVSGTPTVAGSYGFTITATDSATGSGPYRGSQSYMLVVSAPAITLTPQSLAPATVASAYSATITASGGTAPYTYAITTGTLPTGLRFGPDGTISGTPTAGGAFDVTVTATDGNGNGTSRPYTLTVAAPTIAVAPTTLPAATRNVAYSQAVAASGGIAPYIYAVTAGALPTGLTLGADGTLSGTPTAAGAFGFTITATDSATGTGPYQGSQNYTLSVGVPTIAVTPASLPAGTTNAAYSQTLSASGGRAPYSYALTVGALPTGISLAGDTLAGTPTVAGSYAFTVTATDGNGNQGSIGYTLAITRPSIALAPASLPAGSVGTAYTAALSASGGTGPYGYAVTAGTLPTGLALSGATIAGTPSAGGSFTFTVTTTDANGNSGSQAYTVAINAATLAIVPASLPGGTVGATYAATLAASGGTAPYRFAVTTGSLPTGLTLAEGGALSGVPTAPGSYDVIVTATDSSTGSGPYTVQQRYTLSIAVAAPVAGDVSASTAFGSTGTVITPPLTGGATASLAITTQPIHGTASVAGLTLVYTPATGYAGADGFSYQATNASGTSSAKVAVTVEAPVVAIAQTSLPNAQQAAAYSTKLTATGGIAPYAFRGDGGRAAWRADAGNRRHAGRYADGVGQLRLHDHRDRQCDRQRAVHGQPGLHDVGRAAAAAADRRGAADGRIRNHRDPEQAVADHAVELCLGGIHQPRHHHAAAPWHRDAVRGRDGIGGDDPRRSGRDRDLCPRARLCRRRQLPVRSGGPRRTVGIGHGFDPRPGRRSGGAVALGKRDPVDRNDGRPVRGDRRAAYRRDDHLDISCRGARRQGRPGRHRHGTDLRVVADAVADLLGDRNDQLYRFERVRHFGTGDGDDQRRGAARSRRGCGGRGHLDRAGGGDAPLRDRADGEFRTA